MQDFLLSCDWGTSSFRLRLVDIHHNRILEEVLTDKGVATMHNQWRTDNTHTEIEQFYLQELQRSIQILVSQSSFSLQDIPIVISGMVSSVIGIREVPYVTIPFALDGSQASVVCFQPTNEFPHKIYLISGIRSHHDVMRGEETQMVGLAAVNEEIYEAEDAICIFPGTHSKHIRLHKKAIIDFRTYMTGELFYVMTHHSILKDAVSGYEPLTTLKESQISSFSRGIHDSQNSNLLHMLFTVRINHLFKLLKKEDNFYYLSGLLIGTELTEILETRIGNIVLCSGSNLYTLYKLAVHEMDMQRRTILMGSGMMDRAVVEGHIRILNYQLN